MSTPRATPPAAPAPSIVPGVPIDKEQFRIDTLRLPRKAADRLTRNWWVPASIPKVLPNTGHSGVHISIGTVNLGEDRECSSNRS
jgi:hypothetical protein